MEVVISQVRVDGEEEHEATRMEYDLSFPHFHSDATSFSISAAIQGSGGDRVSFMFTETVGDTFQEILRLLRAAIDEQLKK